MGQSKSRVNLISSTTLRSAPGPNGSRIIKVHNGVFKQDYSTLTSDSAYFYPDQNMVDAFGHVVINQGDTVHIYSDKLNYNGNTKIAVLTDHVIMVDKDATLTTNNFTYNTATRIGTYVDGGKLVNKDNTLTSKNGYYFAFTRDAYFRYDVVCKTPDAVIKTDTMRYNSGTRINYFYGPTIITGKDKDNLYTENGTYNTILKQAAFGKNNLYTSKTKSLKGDSLYYDRLKGYGRAVKHVIFTDTEQKTTLLGDFGEYFKSNEEAIVTQNAYMIFVTEDSVKTTSTDTAKAGGNLRLVKADSLRKLIPGAKTFMPGAKKAAIDSLVKNNKDAVDSLSKAVKKLNPTNVADKKLTLQGIKDSVTRQLPKAQNMGGAGKAPVSKKRAAAVIAPVMQGKPIPKLETPVYRFADTAKAKPKLNSNIRYDSLFMAGDTFKTRMITFKDFKLLKKRQYELAHPDTTIKKTAAAAKTTKPEVSAKPSKYIEPLPFSIAIDTAFRYYDYFAGMPSPWANIRVLTLPPPRQPASMASGAGKVAAPKPTASDSLKIKQKADSLTAVAAAKEMPDTTRIRIVNVYNHAKIFKSDLQAKADSMFYSSADSTIRMYVNPMIWTQKSQLSGDTINLQMKHKKLDNLDMFPSAFIVNIEKNDSTHFNQAAGKFMHGTFKNGKLSAFTIIGNAETIYFKRDTVKNVVTDMSHTQSGRAYFNFENGEISSIAFNEKYEAKGIPMGKVKEEDKILKGFIWKPKDRPASKAAILSHRNTKAAAMKKGAAKSGTDKTAIKKPGAAKASADSTDVKSAADSLTGESAGAKTTTDSLDKKLQQLNQLRLKRGLAPLVRPGTAKPNTPRDTVQSAPAIKNSGDSVRRDTSPLKKPAITKH
ncbi:hypothetical protein GCM10022392_27080 [Mucilaginibacter panaciglaebae]|uniref:Organic solvent tolerance-like N-terminal domain-containing protein n=1 Tax=Mucilaginibacter panaciglaebae TaxID=502331 RepID=A0ABP7X0F6_9SPHI